MGLKDHLRHLHEHLGELETEARKLPNKNFADIVASARGKLGQLRDHPDVELIEQQTREHEGKPAESMPFDSSAGASVGAQNDPAPPLQPPPNPPGVSGL